MSMSTWGKRAKEMETDSSQSFQLKSERENAHKYKKFHLDLGVAQRLRSLHGWR